MRMRHFIDYVQDAVNGRSTPNQVTIVPNAYQQQELVKVRNQVENVAAAQVADRESFKRGIQQLTNAMNAAVNDACEDINDLQQNQQQMAQRLNKFQTEQYQINKGHGESIRHNKAAIEALQKRAEAAEKRIANLEKENEDLAEWCLDLQKSIEDSDKQRESIRKMVAENRAALRKKGLIK